METCNVVLTFESVDKILWCDHSNETSLEALLHGTICFSFFYKMKFDTLGSLRVKCSVQGRCIYFNTLKSL